MKRIWILVMCFLLALIICRKSYSEHKISSSEASGLGQQLVGVQAELFIPSTHPRERWNFGEFWGKDFDEFYFTPSHASPFSPTVVVFRKENKVWKRYNFHSALSGDRNILYDKTKYIERIDSGWSKVKSLGAMFEREDWGIMRLSTSAKGTYVFDDYKNNDVIRISRVNGGKREEPMLLGKEINTGKWTAHPFIAPDESYLIWDSEREGGYGGADIYISFRQESGSWGTAINLGDKINSELWENGAMVTSDGKRLLFGRSEKKFRKDGTTYWESQRHWIDAQIIDHIRTKQ